MFRMKETDSTFESFEALKIIAISAMLMFHLSGMDNLSLNVMNTVYI